MPSRRKRRTTTINIIPLVDVLMVLLFFLLVSMQFKEVKTLNISLPEIKTAGQNKLSKEIQIAINQEGLLYLNNQEIDFTELKAALELTSRLKKDQAILLIADENSYLKSVTEVIDLCRSLNLNKFRLQSK